MTRSNKKMEVALSPTQRDELTKIANSGSEAARKVRNARVLLLADEDRRLGRRPDWYIAEQTGVSARQIVRIRQKFARDGLAPVLDRKQRSDAGVRRTIDGEAEAQLIALCCSDPPGGRQRWTVRLLTEEFCKLQVVAEVSRETVRQCLKKTGCNLGGRNASASLKETARGSSRGWSSCLTSTANRTTKSTR